MDLDTFVRNNREAFDRDGPSAALWGRLSAQLPGPNVPDEPGTNPFAARHRPISQTRLRWLWAASVAVLLLAGGLWWVNDRYALMRQPDMVAVSPGHAREMAQYTNLIDTKQAELQYLTAANPALYGQFEQDLSHLHSSYQGLRRDLPHTPNQAVLIRAMVQNLQLQLDLLNEQLRVIHRMNQQPTAHDPV